MTNNSNILIYQNNNGNIKAIFDIEKIKEILRKSLTLETNLSKNLKSSK